ncbi:4,5-DOPA dioxygenase extradiol [Novosphingobium sp. PC22D]|uniref:4,5-DOPA-extradiol-dioxygenase n=1 Tax=Novosphingobium sp. PC22D TaxID=1962403 RepID=UPI000BF01A01|nr:4,5-DOPA dioxygenase extradiol [Novosphingobium sp. PC22D]PEQ13923.1 4,5-DOPA dioxygenase extradiol [Novosphingobium sp. PC22D]
MTTKRMPALFIGHGSPMTVISDVPERRAMIGLGRALPRPRAILAVSAHWETRGRTHVTTGAAPRTIHDFRGFPEELYAMRYRAPGSAWLEGRVADLLGAGHVAADADWGFDHGAWGVVQPMFPEADVPLVAMSLDRALDPAGHLALGRKLAPLRDEGVLIVGSGNVVHNLALWRASAGTRPEWAVDFQQRINAALVAGDEAALTEFAADDRAAAAAINSGEHYLPLLYAAGARLPGDGVTVFSDTIDGALSMTSVLYGDPALVPAEALPAAAA